MRILAAIAMTAALALGVWNTYQWQRAEQTVSTQLDELRQLSQENSDLSYMNYELRTIAIDAHDPNVFTAAFAKAVCAQDGAAAFAAMANGSQLKKTYVTEADFAQNEVQVIVAAEEVDINRAAAASGIDPAPLIAQLESYAASQVPTPVSLLSTDLKLSDGVTCVGALYRGGFVDKQGSFNALYVFVYESATPSDAPDGSGAKTQQWSNFYVFSAGNAGVDNVQ